MPFRKLIEGYKEFYKTYFKGDSTVFQELTRKGQNPEALVIACSDSRIDPAIITGSGPGDIFVVRNVAAIVPPYRSDSRHHGTSAAMEFAVKVLKVKRIVVMGHSLCGGVQALADKEISNRAYEFIGPWIEICEPARQAVEEELSGVPANVRQRALEQAVILTSLNNLMTFPWIAEPVKAGQIKLHGWYFDIGDGVLSEFDPETGTFNNLLSHKGKPDRQSDRAREISGETIALRRFLRRKA